MPTISNAAIVRTTVGVRESLADVIYRTAREETPFITMVPREVVDGVQYDWQTDALDAPNVNNAMPEGFEAARQPITPTVRLSNVCQISTKNATVSGSLKKAKMAGRKKEMAYQMSKKGVALRRDMEVILLSNQARNDGTTDNVRRTRGLEAWVSTNALRGAGGANAANQYASPTDGTQRAFTEQLLKDAVATGWSNGARFDTAMVGPVNKQRFSGFTGRANTEVQVSQVTRIQGAATLYASDFGDIKVVPNYLQRERTCFLFGDDMAVLASYRDFETDELAKIGDADTNQIVVEYGLKVRNEAGIGVIADLTVT